MSSQPSRIAFTATAAILLTAAFSSAHLVATSLVPKGGESFVAGTTTEISWTQTFAHTGIYDIYYSKDGGTTWLEIVRSQQFSKTDGAKVTYAWKTPDEPTTMAMIRVCQLFGGECTNPTYTLASKAMTLTAAGTAIQNPALAQNGAQISLLSGTHGISGAYSLTKNQNVSIEAISVSGQVLATENLGQQNAGQHSISWQPKALTNISGLVLIRLKAGQKVLIESRQTLP